MTLAANTHLGPYRIEALVGAGGMGEVYKARDTRLDRTVAIKVLPPSLADDAERRARFEREAKTIAGLNHPHICSLHDVGDHDGSPFLVMEHVAGETLASRLQKGPLPVEQALTLATEIADALTAAHRAGIIHRDLKPANVMLTKAGVKLMDFGLAKLTGLPALAATSLMTAEPITEKGLVLGTVPYMAPEQLEGKDADARSDLFSFGAVLYEMVSGKRAFEGESHASVIAAILEREPVPLSTLQPLTPPALDRLVRRCLAKAPDDRPDTAHDVADDLRWLRETSGGAAAMDVQRRRRSGVRVALAVAGGVVLLMVGAAAIWLLGPALPRTPMVHTELPVRPADELNEGSQGELYRGRWSSTRGGSRTALAWTPDGRALVFVGRRAGTQQLYVREMGSDEARPLRGTDGAQMPAISPNGQWVAFWSEGKLKKIPLTSGLVAEVVAGIRNPPMGLSWDDRANLYLGSTDDRHIWRVSANGGVPTRVTANEETEWAQILPCPLPGGQVLLYTVRKREWSWGDEEIVAQNLVTGARKVLLRDAADARYVPTGHLVFLRRGVLFAVAFDIERLEPRSAEVALFDGVVQALTGSVNTDVTGAGQFAIAPTGTLAWLRGPVVGYPNTALVSVDRHGRVSPLPAARSKSYFLGVRLAPDGRQLSVAVRDLDEVSLWTYDLIRHTLARLTHGGEAYLEAWAPGSQRLAYSWLKDGRSALALQRADGNTQPEVLAVGAGDAPCSWTPDGRQLVVLTYEEDLAVITIENGHASEKQLTHTSYSVKWPEVSPDGHWLAYGSNESGRFEVYVQPYPSFDQRTPVSVEGGESPAWDGKGQELFFLSLPDATGKRRMMAAEFSPGPSPHIGGPGALFAFDERETSFYCTPVRCYGVAPDGQRFYAMQGPPPPAPPVVTHIDLVQNWFEELKTRVPSRR